MTHTPGRVFNSTAATTGARERGPELPVSTGT